MLDKLRFKDEHGQDYPTWKEKHLGKIGSFYGGLSGKTKEDFETGNDKYITYMSVFKDVIIDENDLADVNITKNEHQNLVSFGDILFTQSSETLNEVGMNSVWMGNKKVYLNSFCFGFKPNSLTDSNPIFLSYILRTPFIHNKIVREGQGSTRYNLSCNRIIDISIPLPSSKEQQKIADFLSTVDDKIENQKEIVANWEEIKKGLIQKIFSQEIRFKDENGQDYSKWHSVSLSDISLITKGQQLNKTNMMEHGDYYVLNGGIEPSGYYNKYNANENTISISEGGNSCGFVKYNRNPFWSGGHNYTLTLHDGIVPYYLYSFLKSKENQIMNLRIGGGIPNIQKSALSNFKIKITQIEEQQKIADFFSTVDKKIKYEKNILNELIELKKGLLQRIFKEESKTLFKSKDGE